MDIVHRCICRCKSDLYHANRKSDINQTNKHYYLGPKLIYNRMRGSKKLSNGLTSQNVKFFLENIDTTASGLKRPLAISAQLVHRVWVTRSIVKSSLMLNDVCRIWCNLQYVTSYAISYSWKASLISGKRHARPHSVHIQTPWL